MTFKAFKNVLIFVCSSCIFAAGPAAAQTRANDFALLDTTGSFHQLSYYSDLPAVVVATHANGAAFKPGYAAALKQLEAEFAGKDIQFFLLNANTQDSRDDIAKRAAELAINTPVLVDETQLVAQTLGMDQVGDLLIINPHTMEVALSGHLGAPEEVQVALQAMLAGEPVTTGTSDHDGAALEFAATTALQQRGVSYSADVAPILERHCVQCHHDGGIGPWAMTNHAMVRGWAAMMREVLMTQRMPPGQVDQHVGKPLLKVAGLSTDEMQTLVHWIDAGAPGDDAVDPLTKLTFEKTKFSFGEPDLVVKIPPQEIPATGILDYRYVPVDLNLDRDVWVKGMEFIPGDPEVVHHVIAYVASPADKTVRGRETGAAQGESVGGFAPGRPGDQFRDNSGRLIRKGSSLLLQMHYTTSGRATVDETEIGLFLHDSPPEYVMSGGVAGQRRFLVPPHAKEHKLEGVQEIERDAYLYDLMPHMHYRGKYMKYTAHFPDGRSEVLLSVPKYNFNWQFNYPLAEPLFLPAGSKLVAEGAMDNSAQNPFNPNPERPVHFGLQTKHEMFFGFTTLRYVGDSPANLTAESSSEESSAAGSMMGSGR